jgi:phosphatidylethanolamine-binding protein (PEBP) family uncharacterized protein
VPAWTAELVLIIQNPDAPLPRPLVHLIATGIPGNCRGVPEGYLSPRASKKMAFGRGSFGRIGYAGPRTVRGRGPIRLRVATGADLHATKSAMSGFALAHGTLTGTYENQ